MLVLGCQVREGGLVGRRAAVDDPLLLLVDACFSPDQLDPVARFFRARRLQVEVARGREEAEDVLTLVFRVFEIGYGGQV